MKQRPDADELLELARRVLRDDESRGTSYAARMAANARAIAQRGIETGEADDRIEFALFEKLYGAKGVADAGLADLNRRLAAEIRGGEWDTAPDALRALLKAQVRARLARVNPKYLKARTEG